jgi:hypothetical protein
MYKPPEFEYHVLIKGVDDYQIISIVKGNDPLYGYGTWDHFSGPFHTWDEAEMSIPNT